MKDKSNNKESGTKEKKAPLLTRLLKFAGAYKCLTYISMILSAISAILLLLPILFIWQAVKEVFEMYPNIEMTESLIKYALLSLGITALSMFIYTSGLMCSHISAFRIARNMRYESIKHLMSLPLGYFNQSTSGKLRRVINTAASATESYLAHQLPDLVAAMVTPIAVLVLLFVFDWKLGLISLIPTFITMIIVSFMFGKNYAEQVQEYQGLLGNVNSEAIEYVRGIPVLKAFGQSVFSFEKFHNAILSYKEMTLVYTYSARKFMVAAMSFINTTPIVLAIAGILFILGQHSDNFLLNFLFYVLFTPTCALMILRIMFSSQNTMIAEDAVIRVENLLNEKPLKKNKELEFPSNFDIKFENVSFKYPSAKNSALNNINLHIKQGTTVALVGNSGGGKSTIAMLIARFWDGAEGNIKIGDTVVSDIKESELMKNISFVFQNTNLYKESILDNVREGKPEATVEEVNRALTLACCDDIIAKLPDGINTVIGTKGVFLSGGQAQRIAIARAILKDAPIILLDEATAFTDPENEHKIQLAFKELAKGKTVLMIAHRLSSIQNVDNIYVVKNGSIVEEGTHKSLLNKDSQYKNMWQQYQQAFVWNETSGAL